MSRGLTPKQRLFSEEYLVDFNATEAAKRTGVSENPQQARVANFSKIREYKPGSRSACTGDCGQ
jgi:phage terminase small subunit